MRCVRGGRLALALTVGLSWVTACGGGGDDDDDTTTADAAAGSDAGSATPDAGSATPDAGSTTPDAGSTTPDAGGTTPDAGGTTPDAGGTTPDAGGVDGCVPLTDCPAGLDCGDYPDGCGGTISCGTCTEPETCGGGGEPNVCGCTPAVACEDFGFNCGMIDNGCGELIKCGTCTAPETCGGGGTPNVCGVGTCTPMACEDFFGPDTCGSPPDGCGGTLTCGTCTAPETCGGGGVPFRCGSCTPLTCEDYNATCGTVPDGCGGTRTCGTCTAPETCGGGGTPNQCGMGTCTRLTCADIAARGGGTACGIAPDGCGGTVSCGSTCDTFEGETCGGGGTPNICGSPCEPFPASTADCMSAGLCGTVDDGCGGTFDCGTDVCPTGQTCRLNDPTDPTSGGTCCTPLTQAEACAGGMCGDVPDGCGGTVQCDCPTGQTCRLNDPTDPTSGGTCCTPLTQAEACAGRMCGDVDDGCGGTLTCGDCGAGQVCDVDAFGGGTGTCVDCVTCEQYGAMVGGQACGMPAATCGVDCGTCMASGEGCSDGSIAPANVCVACTTCADLGGPGVACGTPPDGCGGTLMCGDCGAGQVCDVDGRFGGPPNRCVTCRTCADIAGGGQACGMTDNGCGEILSCGDCTGGQVCGDGVVGPPNVCVDPPAAPTAAGDVVITEIMRDPKVVVDADGEWFELYNPTTTAFDLEGCTISDDGMDSHVIDTGGAGLIIGAGGTLVLGNNMNYDTNGHVPVSYQYDGVTLANSSDELVISCGGTEIARVNYGTGFPTVAGASMNLDKFVLDETANDSAANWCPTLQQINGDPALDRGTPSMENEACPVANCTLSMEDSATCPAADFSDPANAPCGVILLLAGLPCPATPTGNCGGSGDALGGVSILEFARPVTVVDVVFATEVTGASATMTFYDAFGTPVGEVTANGACDGLSSPATSQHVVLAGPAVSAQVTGPAWIDDLVINPPM